MSIYIDKPRNGYSHMISDSVPELHKFALKVGIKKGWYSNIRGKKRPHYDVSERHFERCLKEGAILVSSKEIIIKLKKFYDS